MRMRKSSIELTRRQVHVDGGVGRRRLGERGGQQPSAAAEGAELGRNDRPRRCARQILRSTQAGPRQELTPCACHAAEAQNLPSPDTQSVKTLPSVHVMQSDCRRIDAVSGLEVAPACWQYGWDENIDQRSDQEVLKDFLVPP